MKLLLVAILVLICASIFVACRSASSPRDRLVARLKLRPELIAYVGTAPRTWRQVTLAETAGLSPDVAFIVAYPSGEIADQNKPFFPLPSGVFYTPEQETRVEASIDPGSLAAGNALLEVSHGPTSIPSEVGNPLYATTLRNVGKEPVRVTKFGAFAKHGDVYRLTTITGGFFTAEQFRNWYGQSREWIAPGESVRDDGNYGGPGSLWVYYFETESAASHVAGAFVP
jgi:hypothetical protein